MCVHVFATEGCVYMYVTMKLVSTLDYISEGHFLSIRIYTCSCTCAYMYVHRTMCECVHIVLYVHDSVCVHVHAYNM